MTSGGGFGVFAGVGAKMRDAYTTTIDHGAGGTAQNEWQMIHQIPIGAIQVPITAGAGAYQMNDLLMPKAGFMWSIRRLTASGYSAGSVIAYKGGAVVGGAYTGGGDPFPFAAAGSATIGRAELLFDQGDTLVIVCTGITLSSGFAGVQINGAADCFQRHLLPVYLGVGHRD